MLSFGGGSLADSRGRGDLSDPEERTHTERAHVVRRGHVWVVANGFSDVPTECRWSPHDGPVGLVMVARFAPPKCGRELVTALGPSG